VPPGPGAGGIRGGDHGELQLRHHEDVLPFVAPGEGDVVAPVIPDPPSEPVAMAIEARGPPLDPGIGDPCL